MAGPAVDTLHPHYAMMLERWQRCADCEDGEDAVKGRGSKYLPVLEGQKHENTKAYLAYKRRATFYPAMGRTITGLIGLVMRRAPTHNAPSSFDEDWKDVSLTGQSLSTFVGECLHEDLEKGRAAVALDWSDAEGRPYWVLYEAEDVVNWREELRSGKVTTTLVVVKYCEPIPNAADVFAHQTEDRWRVWQLLGEGETAICQVSTYRRVRPGEGREGVGFVMVDEQPAVPTRRGKPLSFIPVWPIGPTPTLRWEIAKPPLLDLADMVLSHYRSSADLEHGAHFTALPTPYITGWVGDDEKLAMGSGVAWLIANDNAKVGMLEYMGGGLAALEKRCEDKEKKMAVLGARMLEAQPAVQETAEAVKLRHTSEHASLLTIVDAVQLAVQQAMRTHVWWAGQDEPDLEVTLNRDFMALRLDPQEIQALVALVQAGKLSSETLYWNLQQGEVARPGITWEEEKKAIDAEEPDEPPAPEDLGQPSVPGVPPDMAAMMPPGSQPPGQPPGQRSPTVAPKGGPPPGKPPGRMPPRVQ